MATTVEDLKSELTIEMFPQFDEDLSRYENHLAGLIEKGAAASTAVGLSEETAAFDRATKAWSTWRGLDEVYTRMLTSLASVDIKDKMQGSLIATQLTLMEKKVARYEALFDAEVELLSAAPASGKLPPTGHVNHRVKLV